MSVGPFPRLTQVKPWERDLSVDTAGRCFQPHHLGNAKTQTKPFDWSLPPPQPGQERSSLVVCVECSNTPQNLNRAAWAQNQTHTASPRTPDDENPISLLGQYKKHPLNSTCTYPHPSDWPDPLMGTNCHPRTTSLHLPMDLVAWKGTSPATTDL